MKLAFTVTDSYIDYMGTTLLSILQTTVADQVRVYLLTSDISAYSRQKLARLEALFPVLTIEVILVDEADFAGLPLNRSHITRLEVYFRMAFARLLPESVERVLYLDSDLLVQQDLLSLWETDLDGHYMAGVSEPPSEGAFDYRRSIGMTEPSLYFNSGVLLMDLAKIRQDKIQDHLFAVGDQIKDKILLQDQDIINVALEGRIKPLDITYNYGYMERMAELRDESQVAILHFSLEKPWQTHLDVTDYNRSAVDKYRRLHQTYRSLIEPLITVLVPVTASHQELAETLKTLADQTYKHLEVIVLDQTGQDGYSPIKDLVIRTEKCRYYRLMPEANPLLEGVKHARGSYLTKILAGDVVDKAYVAKLYQALSQSEASISLTSPTFLSRQQGVYRFVESILEEGQLVTGRDLLERVPLQGPSEQAFYGQLTGCLMSRDLLATNLPILVKQVAHPLGELVGLAKSVIQAEPKCYLARLDS